MESLNIVVLGLSITSSWGNGHATTYRSLLRGLKALGHRTLFLERNVPWYAENRDMTEPPYGRTVLYENFEELRDRFTDDIRQADLVVIGSFVPEGAEVSRWVLKIARGVVAFYDIDTPVTLSMVERGDRRYVEPSLMPCFDLYFSFTGGPMLRRLEREYRVKKARPLYCSVDEELYRPERLPHQWALGYIGTYSEDRQPALQQLLIQTARHCSQSRFAVAGPLYPDTIDWSENIDRIPHLAPGDHRNFYNSQRFTLNLTRSDMIRAGYSPSVRLFEAAACGTPIISDLWDGLSEFLAPGREILIANSTAEVVACLQQMPEDHRLRIAEQARRRVLASHTSVHRASELVRSFTDAANERSRRSRTPELEPARRRA